MRHALKAGRFVNQPKNYMTSSKKRPIYMCPSEKTH